MRPTQGQSTQVSAVVWIANATFSSLFSNQVLSIQTRPNGCEVVLDERRDHRPQRATNNFTQQIFDTLGLYHGGPPEEGILVSYLGATSAARSAFCRSNWSYGYRTEA
jgi:hypothetical protein